MARQETYFDQRIGDKRITVLKTYDRTFAHQAFEQIAEDALLFLKSSLGALDEPLADGEIDADELWEEIQDGAREDWNSFSYFVVSQEDGPRSMPLYVSSDWPSAEAFAKQRIEV